MQMQSHKPSEEKIRQDFVTGHPDMNVFGVIFCTLNVRLVWLYHRLLNASPKFLDLEFWVLA